MPLETLGFVAAQERSASHRANFRALADAYYHAVDELHHMDHHVRDDFRDVEAHMHTLMDYYGGRDYWDGLGGVSAGDGRRHR